MNKVQRNFKKQISQALDHGEYLGKKGKGPFSNNLFKLRFYGYRDHLKYKDKPIIIKFLIFIFRFLLFIIKVILFIFILAIFYYIIKKTS